MKKYCRRRRILLEGYPLLAGRAVTDLPQPASSTIADARNQPIEQLGLVEEVEGVRSLVSPIEWDLLWGVAEAADYEGLSQQVSKPIGTLKSKVARCRRRLAAGGSGVHWMVSAGIRLLSPVGVAINGPAESSPSMSS